MPLPLFVTKTFLPPRADYQAQLDGIFESAQLTNCGPLVQKLEAALSAFLGDGQALALANGTLALQVALKALGIENGEIITTPFSYVATVSSILLERATPVFVDIEPEHFGLDASKLEKAISPRTRAIMPVQVFGYACEVKAIEAIAARHGLKVIYDGAHAFGCRYEGRSLLSYGDVSVCSFHATKLFHTGEGGAVITRDPAVAKEVDLIRRFGHNADTHLRLGLNAKMSELHAAMGLAVFPHLSEIIDRRRQASELYGRLLEDGPARPKPQTGLEYNYAYYPVLFDDEAQLLRVFEALAAENIFPRRYFYPSLNSLPYLAPGQPQCPVAEDLASRIACLPLSHDLTEADVRRVCGIIIKTWQERTGVKQT